MSDLTIDTDLTTTDPNGHIGLESGRYSPHSITDINSCQEQLVDSDDESDDDGEYIWADLYRLWLMRRNSSN